MAEEQKTGCSPSDCAGCSHAGECGSKPQSLIKPENKKSHINHVIAVVSGKGGVGKSMVTASLARLMREQGFSVGIMDADITGPSIPKMYGIHDTAKGSDDGIFPEIAKDGTKIMSVNLLLPNESDNDCKSLSTNDLYVYLYIYTEHNQMHIECCPDDNTRHWHLALPGNTQYQVEAPLYKLQLHSLCISCPNKSDWYCK